MCKLKEETQNRKQNKTDDENLINFFSVKLTGNYGY